MQAGILTKDLLEWIDNSSKSPWRGRNRRKRMERDLNPSNVKRFGKDFLLCCISDPQTVLAFLIFFVL